MLNYSGLWKLWVTEEFQEDLSKLGYWTATWQTEAQQIEVPKFKNILLGSELAWFERERDLELLVYTPDENVNSVHSSREKDKLDIGYY